MGNGESKRRTNFGTIPDQYKTMEQVQDALRECGLESSNLIIGVDYTKSNTWIGKKTFGGACLHALDPSGQRMNPYQHVISVIARTLEPFDDDHLIPAYGFGDVTTSDKGVFPFFPNEAPCNGVVQVLQRYAEITPHVALSGPTSFAPIIDKAVEIVKKTKQYHILIIIADGEMTSTEATKQAIIRASHHPLSIVMVGVGDGPWKTMKVFDDSIQGRLFDNFQFVPFYETISNPRVENPDIAFAVEALQEIPDQYHCIKELNLL